MTIAGLFALALVDSINPSAIVVTLYLLSTSKSQTLAQVLVYIAAIFVTYFALGAMMLLGLDRVLPFLDDALRGRVGLIVQCVVGLALLVYGLTASTTSGPPPRVMTRPNASTFAALALLGVTVTAMELPTAIPYFAAIALITGADLPIQEWAPLLGVYNLIFVLPPIALLVGHLVVGKRLAGPYAALRERLQTGARVTMLWVAGLVGGALLLAGVLELIVRLR